MKDEVSRWSEINRILDEVLDLEPDQAKRVISRKCKRDEALKQEVLKLWHEIQADEPEAELKLSRSVTRLLERSARQDREDRNQERARQEGQQENQQERSQWFFPLLRDPMLGFS